VSLDDLHSAETKGKWWLVGAAWGGDPLVHHNENAAAAKLNDYASGRTDGNELFSLAQKQGMNTDIRRSIFVVLMSSDVCGHSPTLCMTGNVYFTGLR
jgi:nucleolar MIF4G domain-containing protein 1